MELLREGNALQGGIELTNDGTEENAKHCRGQTLASEDPLCDKEFSKFVLFSGNEEFRVRLFPKQRHDGTS